MNNEFRAYVEALLANEAVDAGATEDVEWLGVASRLPVESLPSWGEGRYRREASHSTPGNMPSLLDVLPGLLESSEFRSLMFPIEGVSRALGGVVGGRNPLGAASDWSGGSPLFGEALVERGAPGWLGALAEFLVPDPMGAGKVSDLIPLLGFIGTGLRSMPYAGKFTDFVSPKVLTSAHGNPPTRHSPDRLRVLGEEIMRNPAGVSDPVVVLYDPRKMVWSVGEGNHRSALAASYGVPGVPVTVQRADMTDLLDSSMQWFGRGPVVQPIPPEGREFLNRIMRERHGYAPANLSPSQLGLPVANADEVSNWARAHAQKLGLSGEDIDSILEQVRRTYSENPDWGLR